MESDTLRDLMITMGAHGAVEIEQRHVREEAGGDQPLRERDVFETPYPISPGVIICVSQIMPMPIPTQDPAELDRRTLGHRQASAASGSSREAVRATRDRRTAPGPTERQLSLVARHQPVRDIFWPRQERLIILKIASIELR